MTMDYEKKYKEALENAKEWAKNPTVWSSDDICQKLYPELKESENEKIRKELLKFLESVLYLVKDAPFNRWEKSDCSKWIAWLEKQGDKDKLTHEDICKAYNIPDIGEFSDGYHTFNGLYKQRMILFAVLVKTYKDRAWKSWKHEDGLDCFGGGWFIVGIDTPDGAYTYHYEAKDWDRFDCQILEKAKHWDGHDEFDVERLFSLVSNDNKYAEWASLEYRQMREECGIKNPVMLDEIEEAYYNGATSIQKPAWSEEDEKMCQETIDWFEKKCFPYALEHDNPAKESIRWLRTLKERLGGNLL